MAVCHSSPEDKKAQAKVVGDDLLHHYGKKPYYSVDEVKAANKRTGIDIDVWCWSHALFNTHSDFDLLHQSLGEACDYVMMKSLMLGSISNTEDASWFNLDLSWLEFPDIDWSIFDFLDFS
jgi:hypothetical protein